MLQYIYYHTSLSGYEAKLSIPRDDNRYAFYKEACEYLRSAYGEGSFVYAPIGGRAFFMQSGFDGKYVYARGISCGQEEVVNPPAKYVNTLIANTDFERMEVTDCTLPPLGRLSDDFSMAAGLPNIFGKLIDALLFGAKRIIVKAADDYAAQSYIKTLALLLPDGFLRNISFCVGGNKIGDASSVYDENGRQLDIGIKLVITAASFDYDSYAYENYVFDTVRGRDNYDGVPSSVSDTLGVLDFYDTAACEGFARALAEAFESGRIDMRRADRICLACTFALRPDAPSAERLLTLDEAGLTEQRVTVNKAVEFLMAVGQSLSSATLQKIIALYKRGDYLDAVNADGLTDYLIRNLYTLDGDGRALLSRMVAEDGDGGRLAATLSMADGQGYSGLLDFYSFALGTLKERVKLAGGDLRALAPFIRPIAERFNYEEFFLLIPPEKRGSDQDLFDALAGDCDAYVAEIMCAALMYPMYYAQNRVDEKHRGMRIAGLRKLVIQRYPAPIDALSFLTKLNADLVLLGETYGESCFDGEFDFLFSNQAYGAPWLNLMMTGGGLSMRDLLGLYNLVSGGGYSYPSMQKAIESKLLVLSYLRENIRADATIVEEYSSFFYSLAQNLQSEEIRSELTRMEVEARAEKEIIEYRCAFVNDCFATLSESDKKRVTDKYPKIDDHDSVEEVIKVFGATQNINRERSVLSTVMMWAFGFAAISLAMLGLIPVIQAILLGSFDIKTIGEMAQRCLPPALLAAPVYVYLLETISYFALRKKKLKRANVITAICGLLPVFVYCATYIVLYVLNLSL